MYSLKVWIGFEAAILIYFWICYGFEWSFLQPSNIFLTLSFQVKLTQTYFSWLNLFGGEFYHEVLCLFYNYFSLNDFSQK